MATAACAIRSKFLYLDYQTYEQTTGTASNYHRGYGLMGLTMALVGLVFVAVFVLYWTNQSVIAWEDIFIFSFAAILLVTFSIFINALRHYDPYELDVAKYENNPAKFAEAINSITLVGSFWASQFFTLGFLGAMCALAYVEVSQGTISERRETFVAICIFIAWSAIVAILGFIFIVHHTWMAATTFHAIGHKVTIATNPKHQNAVFITFEDLNGRLGDDKDA